MRPEQILENALGGAQTLAPSFAFSMHKSGSSLLNGMIEAVCSNANVPSISVPDILFMHGITEPHWEFDDRLLSFFKRGLLFYGFRQLPEILIHPSVGLADKKCVLLLRDPRDALVSAFYSFSDSGSHQKPKHPGASGGLAAVEHGIGDINKYVLHHAGYYLQKLEFYRRHLNADKTIVFRYEDVFFDKAPFIERVFSHFEIEVPRNVFKLVADKFDIRPRAEDQSKHIRVGYPGDFRSQLKEETISQLNEIFY